MSGGRRRCADEYGDTVLSRMALVVADITTMEVDAIVNAANSALCGGGGVDGAIHAAAGPGLLEECRGLGRCPAGNAVATGGHGLKARWIIHAVGPVWAGGGCGESALLRRTYRRALELSRDLPVDTVAFPAISCGAYRFPVRDAARIAVREVARFLSCNRRPREVKLCCFEPYVMREYERAVSDLTGSSGRRMS